MPTASRIGLLLLLAVAFVLRWELLAARSLWIDEALSLDLADGGPRAILSASKVSDPHPPGYYLLLWAWHHLVGDGVLASRIPSFVASILAIAGAWRLGCRVSGGMVALGTAGLLALNAFQVVAANEIRQYAILTFLGLAATLNLLSCLDRANSRGLWVLYGALLALVGYTSYYGFLLILGHAAALLTLSRDRQILGGAGAAGLAFLLCYSPWLPFLGSSITANPVPWRQRLSTDYVLGLLASQTFGGYYGGAPTYHTIEPVRLQWAAVLTPFVGVLVVGICRCCRDRAGRVVIASWLVPVIAVVAGSAVMNKLVAYYYHLTFLQPYGAVLMAVGLDGIVARLRGLWRNSVRLAVAMMLVGALAGSVAGAQSGARDVYRFDRVARVLERERRRDDVVIYYNGVGERVVRRYAKEGGPQVAVWVSPREWTRDAVRPLLVRAVAPLRQVHRRVWVVLTPPIPEGSEADLLRGLTSKGYVAARQWQFGTLLVLLFERR